MIHPCQPARLVPRSRAENDKATAHYMNRSLMSVYAAGRGGRLDVPCRIPHPMCVVLHYCSQLAAHESFPSTVPVHAVKALSRRPCKSGLYSCSSLRLDKVLWSAVTRTSLAALAAGQDLHQVSRPGPRRTCASHLVHPTMTRWQS